MNRQLETHHAPASRNEDQLEALANRLLTQSLESLGRGEYPFYTWNYLRRMNATDARSSCEDDAAHPEPPARAVAVVWQLARKAGLTSMEMDMLRSRASGLSVKEMARYAGVSPAQASRVLRRAIQRVQEHVAEAQESMDYQIAVVMAQEQARRRHGVERHCRPGQEACRETGLCVRRWYLYGREH